MNETLVTVANAALAKSQSLRKTPLGYFVLSMMAGAYVGLGIVLIFAVGAPFSAAASPWTKTVMGAAFGIALSLVIMAGSELFTGNVMVMTVGALRRKVSTFDLGAVWTVSFLGNLAGSLLLAWLVAESGVLKGAPQLGFIQKTAETKMNLPASDLFFRAMLCNWLVCLAVWCAIRATSEAGRLIMVFWCLFAFIGAGFEHSVANMTLLGISLLQDHPDTVTVAGFVHNLFWVTLGNIVSGALFVGGAYWFSAANIRLPGIEAPQAQPQTVATPAD